MPPRYAYWTILAGGLPTAFRAAEREELLPTFKRIQEKHPDAEMKYFARGKLWDSREAAQARRDARPGESRLDDGRGTSWNRERRGRDWRPGGEHRDPRQKFKDAKKDRNLKGRKERFERKNRPPRATPHGDKLVGRHGGTRPEARRANQGASLYRPDSRDRRDRPPREKPHGDPFRRPSRPFAPKRFERNQGTEEPRTPPQPPGPNREPRPADVPKPTPPPRPSEPTVPPPGPPERGRGPKGRGPTRRPPPRDRGRRR